MVAEVYGRVLPFSREQKSTAQYSLLCASVTEIIPDARLQNGSVFTGRKTLLQFTIIPSTIC